jgi:hypothetical protein
MLTRLRVWNKELILDIYRRKHLNLWEWAVAFYVSIDAVSLATIHQKTSSLRRQVMRMMRSNGYCGESMTDTRESRNTVTSATD